jgi:hypothetical protein
LDDYHKQAPTWENPDLGSFLEALAYSIGSADSWHILQTEGIDPEKPTWDLFARFLSRSRYVE